MTNRNCDARWVGLDIGGANLKTASLDPDGSLLHSETVPFALWKRSEELATMLGSLHVGLPATASIAVTMTGELADCFSGKREGVKFIVGAVESAFPDNDCFYYRTDGTFCSGRLAAEQHLKIAAANWHATANYCTRFLDSSHGVMIDIGSTTTDLIPVVDGEVCSKGRTDLGRILAGELVYTGVSRTPLCHLVPEFQLNGVTVATAAELFATILDAYLIAGAVQEDRNYTETADGRPATVAHAMQRVARMLCCDAEELDAAVIRRFAARAMQQQQAIISRAIRKVVQGIESRTKHPDDTFVFLVGGQGEWLASQIIRECYLSARVLTLSDHLTGSASCAVAAMAVAALCRDMIMNSKQAGVEIG